MKAELVPENGDPPIPIDRDLMVVGRRGYCDIVIDHSSLSKRHCVLVKTDGLLVIRDLISTNGTKVKGQKIRWAALLPDDRITLGTYKLRVYLGPDDAPGPLELYQAKIRRANSAAGREGADSLRTEPGSPLAGSAKSPAGGVVPGMGQWAGGGFAEPSPVEVVAPSSKQEPPARPARIRDDSDALIPIVLDDDDDEIIELD
jgi:predicted component of type VI protein secretion system